MRRNVGGLPSADSPGNSGSSFDSLRHTSAYIPQNPGSQMALSKTTEMVSDKVAAVWLPASRSGSIRRSTFSGVILLRMDLTARVTLVVSSSAPPRDHAFAALTMVAPSVPSGSGVRSTLPPFLPALAAALAASAAFFSFQSLSPFSGAAAAAAAGSAGFLPHCASASAPMDASASELTSLMTTSTGLVASSTGISLYRC